MSRNPRAVHDIPSYVQEMSNSKWSKLTNIQPFYLPCRVQRPHQIHTSTCRHKVCKGMLTIGSVIVAPVIQRNQQHWLIATVSLDTICRMLPNVFRHCCDNCQSAFWSSSSDQHDLCFRHRAATPHSNLGSHVNTECSRHGWESERRKHSELETEALCHPSTEHYSDGNNEHLTANVSSITTAQCHHCKGLYLTVVHRI